VQHCIANAHMPNRLAIPTRSAKYKAFRLLAAMERPFRKRPPLDAQYLRSIRNFFFLQYDTPLGSAVHATPLFAAIRKVLPDAYICVAASPMAASVLRKNPSIDRCIVTPDPWQDFYGAMRTVQQMIRQLSSSSRSGPICLATTLGNQRSRLALLAMLAGKAVRAGYILACPLYDLPLTIHSDRSQIESNLDILRVLGHDVSAVEPRVYFGKEDADYAAEALALFSGVETKPRIVYITQNSGGQPNQWRIERFQHVICALSQIFDAPPIFVGSAQEVKKIGRLQELLLEKGINLAGNTIPQLAALLAQCDAVISLDTGTFHVARAVGLPGAVIAPGWQNPIEWLPLGHSKYRVLWNGPTRKDPAQPYLDEVSVEQVLAAANDLLTHFPPSQTARAARTATGLNLHAAERLEAHG